MCLSIYKQNKRCQCLVIDVPLYLIFDLPHCGCFYSSLVTAPSMRSGCHGFETRSGNFILSGICSVYIEIGIFITFQNCKKANKILEKKVP